jgi:hypothetical protein
MTEGWKGRRPQLVAQERRQTSCNCRTAIIREQRTEAATTEVKEEQMTRRSPLALCLFAAAPTFGAASSPDEFLRSARKPPHPAPAT